MSQQYPQQPQQGWPTPGPYGAPQPPKKHTGRNIGFGCLGVIALVVIIAVIAAVASSGGDDGDGDKAAPKTAPSVSASSAGKTSAPAKAAPKKKEPKTVTFKVWGSAPAGALGSADITYGSDSDTRQGKWKDGFTATLPFSKKAMFYNVSAQLQGSGDIHCSVTVNGHTKTAHASGGYNICDAQLSSGLFGDWE